MCLVQCNVGPGRLAVIAGWPCTVTTTDRLHCNICVCVRACVRACYGAACEHLALHVAVPLLMALFHPLQLKSKLQLVEMQKASPPPADNVSCSHCSSISSGANPFTVAKVL